MHLIVLSKLVQKCTYLYVHVKGQYILWTVAPYSVWLIHSEANRNLMTFEIHLNTEEEALVYYLV